MLNMVQTFSKHWAQFLVDIQNAPGKVTVIHSQSCTITVQCVRLETENSTIEMLSII